MRSAHSSTPSARPMKPARSSAPALAACTSACPPPSSPCLTTSTTALTSADTPRARPPSAPTSHTLALKPPPTASVVGITYSRSTGQRRSASRCCPRSSGTTASRACPSASTPPASPAIALCTPAGDRPLALSSSASRAGELWQAMPAAPSSRPQGRTPKHAPSTCSEAAPGMRRRPTSARRLD
jgi:hypothetical protein